MHSNISWRVLLIIIVVGGLGLLGYHQELDFGLDLQGGAEILYKVHLDQAEVQTLNVMATSMDVIERRINAGGVGDFRIERAGEDTILVQLPHKDEKEIEKIKEIIRTTGKLTFHLVASPEEMQKYKQQDATPPGYVWKEIVREDDDAGTGQKILLRQKADFTGDSIMGVELIRDPGTGVHWAVKVTLDKSSRRRFARFTRDHVGDQLAIVLDGVETGKLYSAPSIKEEIVGGEPIITGNFAYDDAEKLARILTSGRLPAPITVEYENVVGPSLGQDSIRAGTKAIIIGMALVMIFMAVYYLGVGLIANVAVVFNLVILVGVLAYLDATLTLPGLAGIVLLVGMSVDANVLIFERIREEMSERNTLSLAVRNGYRRVFVTIMDANLTTLFTAVILGWAGTGPVKGFAVTLGVGLLASMFTALFVTRTIFDILISWKLMSKFRVCSVVGKTSFDFSKYWKVTASISVVVILLGLSLYFQRGREMYDIDFLGGSLIHVRFAESQDIETVRKDIVGLGKQFETSQVQSVWSSHENVSDLSSSREFELRMELPADASEHESFIDNAKARLRESFTSTLAPDIITFRFGPVEQAKAAPYTGGVIVKMILEETIDVSKLEARLKRTIADAKVRGYGEDEGKNSCLNIALITAMTDADAVKSLLEGELSAGPFPRTRKISAGMARTMVWKAIWAMVLAMIGIVIYMAFRFQLRFGIGAVVALLHDVLFTMGALAVAGVEVNLPIIAAFLTIVGYSLNDTIVVFDRIRENMSRKKDAPFKEVVNQSINQTLGRTLLTSVTTLFAAFALFWWGGGVIHNFAYALIVGVVSGTYSSIFIACPVVVLWQEKTSS